MCTVVKQVKSFLAVFSALFITLITTRVRGHTCGAEELVQCAKPLSVLTDSGLTFVSEKSDLERLCPDLKEALRCIHSYTRMCMNINHRRHFKKIFQGTGHMVMELCNNMTYQEEYLKYAPCMKDAAGHNEVCFKRYSQAMADIQSKTEEKQNSSNADEVSYQKRKRDAANEGIKSVCCSFEEYVQCSTHSMRRHCGDDAADFSRNFLDKMASSMIRLHCTEYGSRECGLSSSSSGGFQVGNVAKLVIGLGILLSWLMAV